MASVWCAVGAAWQATDGQSPTPLERFVQRVRRAPAIIASRTVELFTLGAAPDTPLVIVTCSASLTVAACLQALARERPVRIACAESRPAVEGRAMAERLARHGLDVDLYTDAAVGRALDGADALVVGADCVARPGWSTNAAHGCLPPLPLRPACPSMSPRAGTRCCPSDWSSVSPSPKGWHVTSGPGRRPHLSEESVLRARASRLITAVVLDAGVLAGEMVGAACEARAAELDVTSLIERAAELTSPGS